MKPAEWEPGKYATDAFTDWGVGFIDEHRREHSDQPFFLNLCYTAPHFPLHALPEDIEVIDLRSLCPIDADAILASARKTGKVLVAHEATQSCGVGAEVAALVAAEAFEDLDAPVRRLTAPDVPIPFSPPLEQAVLPQLDDMKEACRELLAY